MVDRIATYTPRRINRYVPAAAYSADVQLGSPTEISVGTPSASNATAITGTIGPLTTGVVGSVAASQIVNSVLDGSYRRIVTISGTSGRTATLLARDYLGQPFVEALVMTSGTSSFKKAAKWFDGMTFSAAADTTNPTIGVGTLFGLPYKTNKILAEEIAGSAQTVGTLVVPVLTDPQTSTTGDPRGTYSPTGTPDGTKEITITIIASNAVNSSGNGGLHGIEHVAS